MTQFDTRGPAVRAAEAALRIEVRGFNTRVNPKAAPFYTGKAFEVQTPWKPHPLKAVIDAMEYPFDPPIDGGYLHAILLADIEKGFSTKLQFVRVVFAKPQVS